MMSDQRLLKVFSLAAMSLAMRKTGILAAVDSLEKNFGVAMSNMKRALARFSEHFSYFTTG